MSTSIINRELLTALEEKINNNFLVKDQGILYLVCATVIANKFPGDPVWLFVVSPPSGLKSELIRALSKTKRIFPLSSLTPQTLISGQRNSGKQSSLLHRIDPQTIFTFKDFTTVLSLYDSARQEILSQLREVYDGQYAKSFGTGEEVSWIGKVGFIAGVTEAIDLYQGMYSILGERFLQYRMLQPDRRAATKKGMSNSDNIISIRQELEEMFNEYLEGFEYLEDYPELDGGWIDEIVEISDFATLARSGIKRDPKDREISHVFAAEMPIRFSKQLTLLAKAFVMMGVPEVGKIILRKIALDSLPKNRINVLAVLVSEKEIDLTTIEATLGVDSIDSNQVDQVWKTEEVATALNLPTGSTRRILEDLNALGVIDRFKHGSGNADTWKIKDSYQKILKDYFVDMLKGYAFPET